MPGPIVLPAEFGPGVPLSARQLNDLQQEILRQLYAHTHHGDENGPPLTTDAYEDGSVTNPKLADGSVDARVLADGAVQTRHLTANAVTADILADDSVDTAALQDGAVTEAKLSAAVQLLLRRTGDSASSASQVIWRDPVAVWEPRPELPSIIDTFIDPGLVYWKPPVIGIDPFDNPIQIDPRLVEMEGKFVLEPYKTYTESDPLIKTDPGLAYTLGEAVIGTTQEIEVVGAYEVEGGTFGKFGLGGTTKTTTTTGFGAGTFDGGSAKGVITGGGHIPGITMGGVSPGMVQPGVMHPGFANAPSAMAEKSFAPDGMASAAPEMRAAAAPIAVAAAAAVPQAAASSQSATLQIALTKSGRQAAGRMTSIGSVDINGKPVAVGTEGSYTVSSGFAGKSSFFDDDETLDFRAIGNAGDRKRAAKAGQIMLYNLGIDRAYANSLDGKVTDANIRLIMDAIEGNSDFYKPTNPMWGGNSWLPDILNRPDLFGSGYAISGGRNILDVTRQTTAFIGDRVEYVRIRFITPYLNSAYSVSVTPRTRSGYRMISGQIRNKSPKQCDIYFTGLKSDGTVEDINNLSFDLAVFGKLAN